MSTMAHKLQKIKTKVEKIAANIDDINHGGPLRVYLQQFAAIASVQAAKSTCQRTCTHIHTHVERLLHSYVRAVLGVGAYIDMCMCVLCTY